MREAGQHHVAAVAPAHYRHARRVESRLLPDPVEQRANVAHGVFAFHAVVERQEGLPVTGRPADVWEHYHAAEFVEIIVAAPEKVRARLTFRAAVDIDDHRTRPRKL